MLVEFNETRMKLRLMHLTTFVTGQGNRWTKRTIRGGFAVSGAFASATCGRTKQTLSTRKRKQYASRTSEHAYEHDTRN